LARRVRSARGVLDRTSYQQRTPTATVLHAVVRDHLESFLEDARARSAHGFGVPRHVERELRNYLACGVLAHGFVRVRCVDCGFDRLVAFSCKGRAVCPSCRGRRMADAAAHLVDRVLPRAPYRQWTLSVPWRLRSLLARDRTLLSAALTCFVRAVFRWQRAQARALGLVGAAPGAVTAIQRFGSVLNLNLHFHTLVPDGVFVPDGLGGARFVPLPAPTDDDVAAICARVARRILRLIDGDDRDEDEDEDEDGAGALLANAARSPMGTLPFGMMPPPPPAKRLTTAVDDFTLHADTAVAAHDRDGLERLVATALVRRSRTAASA
jgi:ribosomal protein S27E